MSDLAIQSSNDYEKRLSEDEKKESRDVEIASGDNDDESRFAVLENERDIATHVISVHDDPSLNPWTLRAFIIGIGLSAFGGVLGAIFYPRVKLYITLTARLMQLRSTTLNRYVQHSLLSVTRRPSSCIFY
jgi:hypothetical protein